MFLTIVSDFIAVKLNAIHFTFQSYHINILSFDHLLRRQKVCLILSPLLLAAMVQQPPLHRADECSPHVLLLLDAASRQHRASQIAHHMKQKPLHGH